MFTNDAKSYIILLGIPITYVASFSPRLNLNNISQTNKSHMFTPVEFHYAKIVILQVCQNFLDLPVTSNTKANPKNKIKNLIFLKTIKKENEY